MALINLCGATLFAIGGFQSACRNTGLCKLQRHSAPGGLVPDAMMRFPRIVLPSQMFNPVDQCITELASAILAG